MTRHTPTSAAPPPAPPVATAPAPLAPAVIPAQAPLAPATIPIPGGHHLSDKTLVTLDILVGIITALFGHEIGRQAGKWFQGAKRGLQQIGTPGTATGVTISGNAPAHIDPTIHSALLGIGPWDEAATGMTLGAAFRRAFQRLLEATGTPMEAPIRAALAQLEQTVGFIANKLNQHQRDFLREVVGKLKTAELQNLFWQDLVLASKDETGFINFMKAMGIVHEPNELTQELAIAIAYGFEQANVIRVQMVTTLTVRYDARSDAARQRWFTAHGQLAQGQPVQQNATPFWRRRTIWLVIGLAILAVALFLGLPHIYLNLRNWEWSWK